MRCARWKREISKTSIQIDQIGSKPDVDIAASGQSMVQLPRGPHPQAGTQHHQSVASTISPRVIGWIDPALAEAAMDLRPISTDAEYRAALAEVSPMFDREPEPGTPEGDRFEALVKLIEGYERQLMQTP